MPYGQMYERIVRAVQPYNNPGHVLILASFNLGWSCPPVQQAPEFTSYGFFRSAGGGNKLMSWLNSCEPGSAARAMVSGYILVGIMGQGPDTGVESYSRVLNEGALLQEVFFYGEQNSSLRTISSGRGFASADLRRTMVVGRSGIFLGEN